MRWALTRAALLAGASAASFAAPTMAQAQTGQPAPATPRPAPQSPAPASAAESANPDQQWTDEVVVTGIRESLQAAQQIKRDADSVVEAVTPTDLGNFVDANVADVLQRVPGVQVERDEAATDGDRVSIRGLGSNFVLTTFAGRTPMSSGSEGQRNIRSFNFNTVPSELINGLIVAKTPTASMIEQGLAGTVDAQILRPLDVRYRKGQDMFARAEFRGTYSELADERQPRISGVFGLRNKDRTLGAFISGVWSRESRPTEQISNRDGWTPAGTAGRATFTVDTNNDGIYNNGDTRYTNGISPCTVAPAIAGVAVVTTGPNANNAVACDNTQFDIFNGILSSTLLDRTMERKAGSFGLQWRPSDEWEVMVDYSHTEVDDRTTRRTANISLNSASGTFGAVPVNNATAFFRPGAVFIDTAGGPTSAPFIRGWDGAGLIGFLGNEGSGTTNTSAASNTNFRDMLGITSSVGDFSSRTITDMAGVNIKYSGSRLSMIADLSWSRNRYRQDFTAIELRQRYRNAFTAGDVGFDIIDGFPVVTNLGNLNLAAVPAFGDVFNSADCATRICREYNQSGSLALGTTAAAQYVNAYNAAFSLGSQIRRREVQFDGANMAGRLDFTYEVGGFIKDIQFGARYSISDVDSITSVVRRYAGNPSSGALGLGCTAAQGIGCITNAQANYVNDLTGASRGGVQTVTIGRGTPSQIDILQLDPAAACRASPGFCTDTLANGGLIPRPNSSFRFSESITAPYIGARFEKLDGWLQFTGNIGIRLAYTRWTASAGQVANYNIIIPTTGGGPVVEQCRNTAQASLVAGACPVLPIAPGGTLVNSQSGSMAANGSFPSTATAPLTRGLTSEGDSYLDEIYFNMAPGSLRNPNYIGVRGDYLDPLPALNLNFRPFDNVRLRLGVSTVVSRPDPFQISPVAAVNITDNDSYEAPIAAQIVAEINRGLTYDEAVRSDSVRLALASNNNNVINAGNPNIKPFRAINYDATLEYYTPWDGSIVFSGFYKDVKDFIIQTTLDDIVYIPGYEFDSTVDANTIALAGKPIPFRIRQYVNFSDAKVYGGEVSINQPFTFLPGFLKGFGINANYTYVDSKFDKDVGNFGFGFPGSSKHNINAVGYYEHRYFTFRAAFNYRSDYVRALAGAGSQSNLTRFTKASERLDLTLQIKPIQHFQIWLNAINVTNAGRYDYSFADVAVMDRFTPDRQFSAAVRFNF
jgi:TonB-dependent receptor